MHRDIVWEWLDRSGLEHLSLSIQPHEIVADGLIIVDLGGIMRLRYAVRCDGQWRVRAASLTADRAGEQRTIELARDDRGDWRVDGAPRADLDGCTDIDIMASPFTNTLPIRNLGLQPDETRRLRVAYIKIPDLTVEASDQEYTRLDAGTPPRRFRYRGLASNFVADLTVDADGIVIDYPPFWRWRA